MAKASAASDTIIIGIKQELDTIIDLQPKYGHIVLLDATGTQLGVPVWLCATTSVGFLHYLRRSILMK